MIRFCDNVYNTVSSSYVTLDRSIWTNAREFFAQYQYQVCEHVLLPVMDKFGKCVCCAYEDAEANREIRMLRELLETPGAVQFPDVFSEYKFVRIYGFNELAFFFAEYLKRVNVAVEIIDPIGQEFFKGKDPQVPDHECLTIFAEGIGEKRHNWEENLLRSVSVEFECIDQIYEENIKAGIIKDAKGDIVTLLERLRGENEIIIYGSGREEQAACDFLMKNGIEVAGFVNIGGNVTHRMFGKRMLSGWEARNTYQNAVFIECVSKHSAWGLGKVDYYDYIGYRRNEGFIFLKDYIEIPESDLSSILNHTNVLVTGDIYLCSYVYEYLKKRGISVKGYLDVTFQEDRKRYLPRVNLQDIDSDAVCLIVVPELFELEMGLQKKKKIIDYLKENNIDNYTDYFSTMTSFINIEAYNCAKYTRKELTPKRIVIGATENCCGNIFLKSLLDGHPSILLEYKMRHLDDKLFWLCICLSNEPKENILSLFEEIYVEEWEQKLDDLERFNQKMSQLLDKGERFTSQELFVMFHIAYVYMSGRELSDVSDMIIYWEPHDVPKNISEECVKWLAADHVICDIVNVVRNIWMRHGSALKHYLKFGYGGLDLIGYRYAMLMYPTIDKKDYEGCDRLVVRFEDIKCNPREVLMGMCKKWDISWSDTLLKSTRAGKSMIYNNGEMEIRDFDLGPVYNMYEDFFSEFDRFRISLICAPWQRTYGYPYVEISGFSRRELQEMFLKPFRFEDNIKYVDSKLDFDISLQATIRYMLQKVRVLEFYQLKK